MIDKVNDHLEKFADEGQGTSYVDCSNVLLSSGRLKKEFIENDGVSLTRRGMERVVRCLKSDLDELDELEDIDDDNLWSNR